jgi:hypothetical protein
MALQNTVHGMSGCHKRMHGSRKIMNALGKITQVITLLIKMYFNESLNVSCNIWHCKNYSQNASGKLRTANVFLKSTQNISV